MTSWNYDTVRNALQIPLKTVYPEKYKQDTQSWAHDACERITHYNKAGGWYNGGIASLNAFVFPFFAGATVIQKGATTWNAASNYLLGNQHQDESVSLEAREFLLSIGGLIYSILAWLPSTLDPSILSRKDRQDRPPTHTETQLTKAEERVRELEKLNTTARRNAGAEMFPVITSHNLGEVSRVLQAAKLDGITIREAPKHSKEQYTALAKALWGTPEKNSFEKGRTACEDISLEEGTFAPLKKPEFIIHPERMITLRIDCKVEKISPENLKKILMLNHDIGALELIDADLDFLLSLDEEVGERGEKVKPILSKIHSLVLRDSQVGPAKSERDYTKMEELARKYPNIACFDLRECRFNTEDFSTLSNEHIVLYTIGKIQPIGGSASHYEEKDFNNIVEQLNSFNRKCHAIVDSADLSSGRNKLEISKHIPSEGTNELFHCFAFCVTKLSFLRGTNIRTTHLETVMPKLRQSFPNLTILDLSFCKLLDCDTLIHLTNYPVKNLYLHGCDGIFGRYKSSDRDPGPLNDQENFLRIHDRNYLLEPFFVSRLLIKLFDMGTELVRFDQTALDGMEYPFEGKFKRELKIETYLDYLMLTFRRELFHEMDTLLKPPHPKPCRVVFKTGAEGIQYPV